MKRPPSLMTKFAIVSVIPILPLGVVLGQTLRVIARNPNLANAERTAQLVAGVVVKPNVTPQALIEGVSPEQLTSLDAVVRSATANGSVSAIRIWNRERRVIYADDHSLIGVSPPFRDDENLAGALHGRVGSRIVQSSEVDADSNDEQLLQVYVPLRFDPVGRPSGAFEMFLPYEPVAVAIAQDTKRIFGLLAGGLLVLYVLLFRIMWAASRRLRAQADENRYQAIHDVLTGLPNRALFHDRLAQALLVDDREGTSSAVLLIDLDRFKEVNDTLGHHNGDLLLCQVADRLRAALRDMDTISRLGGDEFAVLLPHTSESGALPVAEKLLQALETPFTLEGVNIHVEASIGVAIHPEHGRGVDVLLQRADVAMYAAKEGHTGCEVYTPDDDSYTRYRLVLVAELRRALEKGDLALFYQPQVDLATGSITGAEALVRWHHPERGLLGPSEFIPAAERTGLIAPLTQYVLNEALRQCRTWQEAGLDWKVAVNLSARNLVDLQFPGQVGRLLEKWRIDPSRLELDITETSVSGNPERALKVLKLLSALGVSLALDDFGTGHSTLAYLKQLAVKSIKIDKSFVINMEQDASDRTIVQSMIALGRNLGLEVVAEGVETEQAWGDLELLGCEAAQGFYVARPVPAGDLMKWAEDWQARPETRGPATLKGLSAATVARHRAK